MTEPGPPSGSARGWGEVAGGRCHVSGGGGVVGAAVKGVIGGIRGLPMDSAVGLA